MAVCCAVTEDAWAKGCGCNAQQNGCHEHMKKLHGLSERTIPTERPLHVGEVGATFLQI
jgi:hypothetical protein